jgi:hypothetical protein
MMMLICTFKAQRSKSYTLNSNRGNLRTRNEVCTWISAKRSQFTLHKGIAMLDAAPVFKVTLGRRGLPTCFLNRRSLGNQVTREYNESSGELIGLFHELEASTVGLTVQYLCFNFLTIYIIGRRRLPINESLSWNSMTSGRSQ